MNNRKQGQLFPRTAGLAVITFITAVSVSCLANGRAERASLGGDTSDSSGISAQTQERKASRKIRLLTFDKKVHNFGDITNEDGPQTCIFKYSNQTDTTILIYDIKTTCECTKVEWSRKPIRQGDSGEIKVTYANEGAPHHFDKGVQVYTSTWARPILLRIQGTVKEK